MVRSEGTRKTQQGKEKARGVITRAEDEKPNTPVLILILGFFTHNLSFLICKGRVIKSTSGMAVRLKWKNI